MTFCVGLRVDDGLVALADTQIVRGGEVSSQGAAAPPDPEVGHANGQGNANGRSTRNGSSNGVANGNVRGAEADAPGQADGKALGTGHDKQLMTPEGGPDSGGTVSEAVGPPGP